MDNRRCSNTSTEHRGSVRRSNHLAVGEGGHDDLLAKVSPSSDSTVLASMNDGRPSSDPTSVTDCRLLTSHSVHSQPLSIANPGGQDPPQSQNDGVSSKGGSCENLNMLMPAEAPYEGPSVPSHPYRIYPPKGVGYPHGLCRTSGS